MMQTYPGAAPAPDGYVSNLVDPSDILHTVNMVLIYIAFGIITPFVFIRLYCRVITLGTFNREDWVFLAAWISFNGQWICGMLMNHFGAGTISSTPVGAYFHRIFFSFCIISSVGYHLWDIRKEIYSSYPKASYASSILYSLASFFTTTSLLPLFVRVFAQFRKIVLFLHSSMAIIFLFCIGITIVNLRICTPVAGFWHPSIPHTCLNRKACFVIDSVISVLSDLIILIPPIPLTWNLRMSLGRKVRIMGLLGAGGLATGTSFLRLGLLLKPESFNDSTVSFVRFNFLGISEVVIGLLCAFLPSLHILINREKISTSPLYVFPSEARRPRNLLRLDTFAELSKDLISLEACGDVHLRI